MTLKVKACSKRTISYLIFLVVILCITSSLVQAQEEDKLKKAQSLYQHENYEEALALLNELSIAQPQSSDVAYYLGMTYKRLQDFAAAKPHLEAAVTLEPSVKNAFLELIDLLYQSSQIEEAKTWIAAAEKESVNPAQVAFFKGLVLLKEGKDAEGAIKSFEDAERLNSSLAQTVKYQKGLAYVQLKKFKEAKNIFQEIVAKDPSTDLAKFANEYVNALARREEITKPFHGSIGYSMQYDDNVVFRPNDDSLATVVSQDKDWGHVFTAQGDYKFKITDHFGLNTGASFYGTKHNRLGFYDLMSYDFPIQPTFYLKKASIAFPFHYNYVDVNNRKYLGTIGMGNLNNLMLTKNQIAQLQLQYNIKDFQWDVSDPHDVKKSHEYLWALGWYYLFSENKEGLINVRYAMNYDDTEGENWRYVGKRLTFTSVVPLMKKLKWDFMAEYFRQHFLKGNFTYQKSRHDDIFTVVNLFVYQIYKNTELQLQHTFTYDSASIGVFKYKKNTYSAGVKYRF
jgi:tetratricopeptide (TPR) repeat protein